MLDDLATFYADFGTLVTREGGAFRGLLDVADQLAFDAVTHGTHVLRYPADVALADGDDLVIGAATYTVAAPPRRINDGREAVADLVRA